MPHVARLGRQLGVGVHGQGQVAHDVAYGLDAVGKDVHGQVGCLGGDLDGGILGHEERLAFVGGEVAAVQAEAEAALAAQHQAQAAYAVRVAQGGREGGKGAFGTTDEVVGAERLFEPLEAVFFVHGAVHNGYTGLS